MFLTCIRCHHDWDMTMYFGFTPLSNVAWALQAVRCPKCNAPNEWIYTLRKDQRGKTMNQVNSAKEKAR